MQVSNLEEGVSIGTCLLSDYYYAHKFYSSMEMVRLAAKMALGVGIFSILPRNILEFPGQHGHWYYHN